MSIRSRLLFLVFAVWLPAVAGFAVLARSIYEHQVEAARDRVLQLAQSVGIVVERELDKRAVMARMLGASAALAAGELEVFHREASAATAGTDSWVILVTPTEQLVNTRYPYTGGVRKSRSAGATQIGREPLLIFRSTGTVTKEPVITAFAPQSGSRGERAVGVAFRPAVVQAIVDQHTQGQDMLISVIDGEQRIMARSRDPQMWLGKHAGDALRARAAAGKHGFAETITLDGVASLTYLSRPSRYRWNVVVAAPAAGLAAAARQATLKAVGASAILLAISIALVVPASRRISRPLHSLRRSAQAVGRDAVPPLQPTGVDEADEVNAALHQAAQRIQAATRGLEHRVAEAVHEAQEAQRQRMEGQKHEAIGRLTGGLAHDFNNLLQTISMALQVMERAAVEPAHRRALDAAMRATGRAAELVRQMLTFGRAQPLQPTALDFADFLLKNRELLGNAVDARITLDAAVEPGLQPLHVDPAQLELALLNLVFNARDALPEGGCITISARAAPDAGRGMTCIEVRDNGIGMNEETRIKALDPYFTTKPVGRGSGLGLAQVHAFAEQSGGRVAIESTHGQGTVVTMLLPSVEARAPAPDDATEEAAVCSPIGQWRVLMVEDDVLVASVVTAALRAAGHEVTLCTTADEALIRLEQPVPPYDVVFSDVVMPGEMSGADLVRRCREHHPSVACVMASGYAGSQAEGEDAMLAKPYTLGDLLRAIDDAARSVGRAQASEPPNPAACTPLAADGILRTTREDAEEKHL